MSPRPHHDTYGEANRVAAMFDTAPVLRTAQDERRRHLADEIRALIHLIDTEVHPPVFGSMLEARCTTCGEVFVPADYRDLVHLEREDGRSCDGAGVLTRAHWL